MLGLMQCRSGAGWWRVCAVTASALVVLGMSAAARASSHDDPAPVHMAPSGGIPGQYIVVLDGDVPDDPTKHSEHSIASEDTSVASSVGADPLYEYDTDMRGFAADLTDAQVEELSHDPRVKYIDQDEHVHGTDAQANPGWGLDRIDQRSLPLDAAYNYPSTGGEGITAYVIDTGIEANHPDFGSRASSAANFVDQKTTDGNGHGTHVAGIIGGTEWGVAKRVKLVGVRALNDAGSGTFSGVVEGENWVAQRAVANKSVVNMSLGGGSTQAVIDATKHLFDAGVLVVAAAGNNNGDACRYSPANTPTAVTVGATDIADKKASFSNYGTCVDTYAPGSHITSDWLRGGANTISGTSMAAPYVAGVAALYLAAHPSPPADVTKWLVDHATPGVVAGNLAGTPNRLIFAGGF
jgi:serine protease